MVEVYLVGCVEFVEQSCADYLSVVKFLDGFFEIGFLVGVIIQGIA